MAEGEKKQKSPIALREEETVSYWEKNAIFEQSVERPAGGEPKGEFVFFDGPPFATGLPHYGHLIPGSLKDALPRYKTMRGYRVRRRWGWDCHGLPIENLVEKELGLKTKKDIEEYGVEKFNEAARESVLRYEKEWRAIMRRTGRWVDMDNDYKTMDPSYTESVWWAFKNLYDKGLIVEGYKAMHLCPRCETTLSNFEVNQGYKDIADISVYVKFELADEPGTFIVAWTTTPWTLPGNVALAVNPDIDYVRVKTNSSVDRGLKIGTLKLRPGTYIFSEKFFNELTEEGNYFYGEPERFKGSKILGKEYKPLFDYYDSLDLENRQNGFKIYGGSFVTTEDGTGVVHIAPAFGEDDMVLGREKQLPFIQHVGTDGRFKKDVRDFAGLPVKPKDDHKSADIQILKYLDKREAWLIKRNIKHSYPHCWRCDTPLLNYAASSWFVKVTAIKDELLANNHKTEWVPAHMRDGRFGKWLEGARDWSISRSRYWGAPIPVWRCADCHAKKVAGSFAEISKPAKNRYIVMRHGESESNVKAVVSCDPKNPHHLTERGKEEARRAGKLLAGRGVDLIIASDFVRTKETAEIVCQMLGLPASALLFDPRVREVNFGSLNNKPVSEYRAQFPTVRSRFEGRAGGGETLGELKDRVADLLFECEEKYTGKTIVFISHEYSIWMLSAAARGLDARGAEHLRGGAEDFIATGEVRELPFSRFPHNRKRELDAHRPYIDEVTLSCECGGEMRRVPEVFDCWFESGSMPFAEVHHPFSADAGSRIPADFIAEGLDQTRGWFYSLMVLSTALFGRPTFEHVIVNGLLLGEDGQKMSKRFKNYPEIDHVLDRYGMDALRMFLLGSPLVHAEEAAFSEKSIDDIAKKIIMRLENSLALYELGRNGELVAASPKSDHVLDRWIVARLDELIREITEALERYEIDRAVRPFHDFVEDFSAWYLRRSRERLKGVDLDRTQALQTIRYTLETFSKLLAPLMPFLAEHLYQSVAHPGAWSGSVHLEAWPEAGLPDGEILSGMAAVRKAVEEALALRAEHGIKVRQPLSFLRIPAAPYSALGGAERDALFSVLADEINVKEVISDTALSSGVVLDTAITDELRAEGEYRDLVRSVQDKRKEAGLSPRDLIRLSLAGPAELGAVVSLYKEKLASAVGAQSVVFKESAERTVAIEQAG